MSEDAVVPEGTIVVRLPEGPTCAAPIGEDVKCMLPLANGASWHEMYGGHLANVTLPPYPGQDEGYTGYVTWQEGAPEGDEEGFMLTLRPDVVDA